MINLDKRILEVEDEYLTLLQSIEKTYTETNMFSILDSIRLFWYKNRKLVSLFLQTLKDKEAFSYTGATHLDVNDNEYYGFLAVGKIHVMDDQLYKYADILLQGKNFSGIELIKKQIFITLKDNIQVLTNLRDVIFLLPVRLFYDNLSIVHNAAEQCFLSFFNNKYSSIQQYLSDCITEEDINSNISENIKRSIYICDNDDLELSFIERIKLIPDSIYKDNDISVKFFLSIQGMIISALEILESMHDFGIIPIIRNRATLSYIYLLEPNLNQDVFFLNKIVLGNEIFAIINKHIDRFENIPLSDLILIFDEKNPFENLFRILELSSKSIGQINMEERISIINDYVTNILKN